MYVSSKDTIDTGDALQVVRLLKEQAQHNFIWSEVEEVLLSDAFSPERTIADSVLCESSCSSPSHSWADKEAKKSSLVRYDDDRLQKALLFIHQHVDEAISVEDITRDICVSRRWLEYAFRAAFRITPFQYLRCVRLELARLRLMNEPRSTIQHIALHSGFTSARQFTMTFRQYFGYSPSVCRNQLKAYHRRVQDVYAEAC